MVAALRSRASRIVRSPSGLVLLVLLAIASFFLVTGQTANLFGWLPYALLLLCPLLHLLLHGGHGGHGGPGHDEASHGDSRPRPPMAGGR